MARPSPRGSESSISGLRKGKRRVPRAEDVSWKMGEGSSHLALCVTPSEKPPFPSQSELEVLPTCFPSTCLSPYQPHPLECNFAGRAGASVLIGKFQRHLASGTQEGFNRCLLEEFKSKIHNLAAFLRMADAD